MNVNPVLAHASVTPHDSASSGTPVPDAQGLNDMFLQLLVAQLQHQSPLSPMDPAQFVGQLAQFSELSEVTQINQLLQNEFGGAAPAEHAGFAAPPEDLTKPASLAASEAMISSAVQAAQAAHPQSSRITSQPQIEGVF